MNTSTACRTADLDGDRSTTTISPALTPATSIRQSHISGVVENRSTASAKVDAVCSASRITNEIGAAIWNGSSLVTVFRVMEKRPGAMADSPPRYPGQPMILKLPAGAPVNSMIRLPVERTRLSSVHQSRLGAGSGPFGVSTAYALQASP